MSTLTSKIQALLTYANGISGKNDTTLGDAVKSLADGFGVSVNYFNYDVFFSSNIYFSSSASSVGWLKIPVENGIYVATTNVAPNNNNNSGHFITTDKTPVASSSSNGFNSINYRAVVVENNYLYIGMYVYRDGMPTPTYGRVFTLSDFQQNIVLVKITKL